MRELINTFSDLYIDSDEDNVRVEDNVPVDESHPSSATTSTGE